MDRIIALPNQLICSKTDLKQFSGIFPEIGYYWLVNENRLLLWSYMSEQYLSVPNDFNQEITHVHLAKVVNNVFDDSVSVSLHLHSKTKYILIITTRIEVVAYPLSYDARSGVCFMSSVSISYLSVVLLFDNQQTI